MTKDIVDAIQELKLSVSLLFTEIEVLEDTIQESGLDTSKIKDWDQILTLKSACAPLAIEIVVTK